MTSVPTEAEYVEAFARFVETLRDHGVDIGNARRDPATGGYTFSMPATGAPGELLEAALEQLRSTEIPYVAARLAETDPERHNRKLSDAQLRTDGWLAIKHGLSFSVTGVSRERRPDQGRERIVEVRRVGDYSDPGVAIAAARSLGQEALVAVRGRPYWDSRDPDVVATTWLHQVAFEAEAGPEQSEYVRHLRHVVSQHERLQATLAITPEVVAAVHKASDEVDALDRLTSAAFGLSASQARHLLTNVGLRQLTVQGRTQLENDARSLKRSYPSTLERANESEARRVRLEIVEGLIAVLTDPAAALTAVVRSESRDEAKATLMASPFNLSEIVAAQVLDLQFGRATERERADLVAEAASLREQIEIDTGPADA